MMKKLASICLAVMMVLGMVIVPVMPTQASSEVVTKKMSSDKNLKKISQRIAGYTTAMLLSEEGSKKTKLTLDVNEKMDISAFVLYQYREKYQCTETQLKREATSLFGTMPKTEAFTKIVEKSHVLCMADKSNTKCEFCGGDFGDVIPEYKITKIVQVKKNVYDVTIQNIFGVYGEDTVTKIGKTVIRLEKNKASKYGYIVKKITYKGL